MQEDRYIPNIPDTGKPRIVVVGSGFAGLKFIRRMLKQDVQIILLDRNNYHQFQPLFYQVATSGLEPSSISFPIRKILQKKRDVHFRIAEVTEIHPDRMEITTNIGRLHYDHLVLAMGATTNYFGNRNIEKHSLPMKTSAEAIHIRNTILENFELALLQEDPERAAGYLNLVLVGGGPTGVEMAGALAEMKKYIFPKDYPELDLSKMRIVLYEASERLLSGMSGKASDHALRYLQRLGVEVRLDTRVTEYDGELLQLSDGSSLPSRTVIWAAGVKGNPINGLPGESSGPAGRLVVDRLNRVSGTEHIYAVGDLAYMETPAYGSGHPQVAQVAIQQAGNLAFNLGLFLKGKTGHTRRFEYKDRGSMATVGRHLAVADLPGIKLRGYLAWFLWSVVHLFTIMGVKNRLITFLNWSWNYFTYDQSLRLLIRHKNTPAADLEKKAFLEVPGDAGSPGEQMPHRVGLN